MQFPTLLCLVALVSVASAFRFNIQDVIEVADMVADTVKKEGDCVCTEHECNCDASINGYNVSVNILVDETPKCEKCTLIVGRFIVNDVIDFERIFPVNKDETYCKTVKGKKYCFEIEVDEHNCCCHMCGHVRLTSPITVNLGHFCLPMMAADNDVAIASDDDKESTEMFFE